MTKPFEEEKKEIFEKTSLEIFENRKGSRSMKRLMRNLEDAGLLRECQLPEVPEFVADEIYSRRYVSSSSGITPSDGLLLMEVFRDLNSSHDIIRNGISFKESKFYQWMKSSDNNKTFVEAVLKGYTVQKPKRFYLKLDKQLFDIENCASYLDLYVLDFDSFVTDKSLAKQFTQEEIDSMQTGSYEKIEVEE